MSREMDLKVFINNFVYSQIPAKDPHQKAWLLVLCSAGLSATASQSVEYPLP